MKTPALFKEYIWLVNTIYKAKAISLRDINERKHEGDGSFCVSKRMKDGD